MAERTRTTDAEKARILELHGQGMSRNDIARETGRSNDVVSRTVRAAGKTFERGPEVAAAVAAKQADNSVRRQDIKHRIYVHGQLLMGRVEADEFETLVKGKYGAEEIVTLRFVPPNDEKAIAQSVGSYMATAAKLEAIDSGAPIEAAKSMLADLGSALGVAFKAQASSSPDE